MIFYVVIGAIGLVLLAVCVWAWRYDRKHKVGVIGDARDSVGDAGYEVIVQTQMKYRGPM